MVHQLLANGRERNGARNALPHKVDDLLVRHDVPNAVARDDEKLAFFCQIVKNSVRICFFSMSASEQQKDVWRKSPSPVTT